MLLLPFQLSHSYCWCPKLWPPLSSRWWIGCIYASKDLWALNCFAVIYLVCSTRCESKSVKSMSGREPGWAFASLLCPCWLQESVNKSIPKITLILSRYCLLASGRIVVLCMHTARAAALYTSTFACAHSVIYMQTLYKPVRRGKFVWAT